MRKFLFLILLFPALANADTTRYVRTDNANNGDGTTSGAAASPGATGAYNSCANAEADIQSDCANNLVTCGGGIWTIDAAGTTADGTCTFSGSTTDSTHYMKLVGDHTGGPWSTSKYRLTGNSNATITINDQYVWIDKVQVETTGTSSGNYAAIGNIYEDADGINTTITNSIIRFSACNTGGGGYCGGIYLLPGVGGVADDTTKVINNIIYGSASTGISDGVRLRNPGTNRKVILYGNTIYNADRGTVLYDGGSNDSLYLKNNVISNTGNEDFGFFNLANWTTKSTATNISEDSTSPESGLRTRTCTYVNTTFATMDLHLDSGDTNCKDDGTDLSSDASSQYSYSTDIDGTTRAGTWDVGADEIVSSSSGAGFTTLKMQGYY